MALKDTVVNFIMSAKNLLSSETDAAADSLDNLADSAEGLKGKLQSLEDQGNLAKQFTAAEKAVSSASKEWDAAGLKVDKLKASLDASGKAAAIQAQELKTAETEIKDLAQVGKTFGDEFEAASLKVQKLQASIDKNASATAIQRRELELAEGEVEKSARAYARAEDTLASYGEEAAAAGLNTAELGKEQKRLADESEEVAAALNKLDEKTKAAKAGQEAQAAATEKQNTRLKEFGRGLAESASSLVKWGAALAAGSAAASLVVLTRLTAGQAELARQTLQASAALGVSTDSLQSWEYAAASLNLEGGKVRDIFRDVSKNLGDAFLTGTGPAVDIIKGLNLNLRELVQMSPDQALLKIANELDRLGDPANKVFVLEALANDASKLLPLLTSSAAQLKALQDQAKERGVIISEEDLQKLKATDEAFQKIGDRLTQFKNKVASELAPTFTKISEDFEQFLSENPRFIGDISETLGALVEKTSAWVKGLLDHKEEITTVWQDVGQGVSFFGNAAATVFGGVQTLISGMVTWVTGLSTGVAGLIELAVRGANLVGLASDDAVVAASLRTQNLKAATEDLAAKTADYARSTVEAGKAAASAFDATGGAAKSAGQLIAGAAAAAKDMVKGTDEAAAHTGQLGATQQQLGEAIAETVKQIEAATAAWQKDPSAENIEKLDALKAKYKELQDQLASLAVTVPGAADSGLVDHFQKATEAIEETTTTAKDAKDKVADLSDETAGLADDVKEVGNAATDTGNTVGGALAGIFGNWAARIAALSEAATVFFHRELGFKNAAIEAGTLQDRLAGVNEQLRGLKEGVVGSGLEKVLREYARAGLETERSFLSQQIAMEDLTDDILNGRGAMDALRWSADDVQRRFNLLDQQQLSGLLGAIESVKREADALGDSIDDTINASRQELAALRGDTESVENLRFQERKLELQEQLNKAQQLGDKETITKAQEALKLAEEAHKIRLRQAQEATAAEKARQLELDKNRATNRQDDEREERQDISRTEERTQSQTNQLDRAISRQTVVLDLRVNGQPLGQLTGLDPLQIQQIIRAIENSTFLTTG